MSTFQRLMTLTISSTARLGYRRIMENGSDVVRCTTPVLADGFLLVHAANQPHLWLDPRTHYFAEQMLKLNRFRSRIMAWTSRYLDLSGPSTASASPNGLLRLPGTVIAHNHLIPSCFPVMMHLCLYCESSPKGVVALVLRTRMLTGSVTAYIVTCGWSSIYSHSADCGPFQYQKIHV